MTNSRRKWLQLLAFAFVPMLAYPVLLRGLIEAFDPKLGFWQLAAGGKDALHGAARFFIFFHDLLAGIWSRPVLFFGLWFASGVCGAALWRRTQARKHRSPAA